ncbi:MAG TPA: hypothetical protein VGY57_07470, partial [Vicinamibacterales bacterium]|nr:hypothetical protein [Vicinamibacterales bacterium]
LRLQRMVEGSPTACVLVVAQPMARSSAGLTLNLAVRDVGPCGRGIRFGPRLFDGLDLDARVVQARHRSVRGAEAAGGVDVRVPLSTAAS